MQTAVKCKRESVLFSGTFIASPSLKGRSAQSRHHIRLSAIRYHFSKGSGDTKRRAITPVHLRPVKDSSCLTFFLAREATITASSLNKTWWKSSQKHGVWDSSVPCCRDVWYRFRALQSFPTLTSFYSSIIYFRRYLWRLTTKKCGHSTNRTETKPIWNLFTNIVNSYTANLPFNDSPSPGGEKRMRLYNWYPILQLKTQHTFKKPSAAPLHKHFSNKWLVRNELLSLYSQ